MPDYCTQQNMIDRLGQEELIQLTDRNDTGSIDVAVLSAAIADASAEMDGYISTRYKLPLSNVPSVLSRIACNIARYNLYDDAATDQVAKLHDDAIAFLKSVSKGSVSLGLADDGSKAEAADTAQMETGGRVFGRGQGGFI